MTKLQHENSGLLTGIPETERERLKTVWGYVVGYAKKRKVENISNSKTFGNQVWNPRVRKITKKIALGHVWDFSIQKPTEPYFQRYGGVPKFQNISLDFVILWQLQDSKTSPQNSISTTFKILDCLEFQHSKTCSQKFGILELLEVLELFECLEIMDCWIVCCSIDDIVHIFFKQPSPFASEAGNPRKF